MAPNFLCKNLSCGRILLPQGLWQCSDDLRFSFLSSPAFPLPPDSRMHWSTLNSFRSRDIYSLKIDAREKASIERADMVYAPTQYMRAFFFFFSFSFFVFFSAAFPSLETSSVCCVKLPTMSMSVGKRTYCYF
jgi:hypothetical protein